MWIFRIQIELLWDGVWVIFFKNSPDDTTVSRVNNPLSWLPGHGRESRSPQRAVGSYSSGAL